MQRLTEGSNEIRELVYDNELYTEEKNNLSANRVQHKSGISDLEEVSDDSSITDDDYESNQQDQKTDDRPNGSVLNVYLPPSEPLSHVDPIPDLCTSEYTNHTSA